MNLTQILINLTACLLNLYLYLEGGNNIILCVSIFCGVLTMYVMSVELIDRAKQ